MNIKKLSLKVKFLLPVLTGVLLLLFLASIWLTYILNETAVKNSSLVKSALTESTLMTKTIQSDELDSKIKVIASLMAKFAPDFIYSQDYPILEAFEKETEKDEEVAFAIFLDTQGKSLIGRTLPQNNDLVQVSRFPIVFDGDNLGQVMIGTRTDKLVAAQIDSDNRLLKSLKDIKTLSDESNDQILTIAIFLGLVLSTTIALIVILLFKKVINNPISKVLESLSIIADGDLTHKVEEINNDEIGQLSHAVNILSSQLHAALSLIDGMQSSLLEKTVELNISSKILQKNASQQGNETTAAAAALEQVSQSIEDIARRTSAAAAATDQANTEAASGTQVVTIALFAIDSLAKQVGNTSEAMERLQSDSLEIGSALNIIREISEQTNLLALNAAIEAARAGEYGRGFAVVADEVRALSLKTQKTTQLVDNMINRLQTAAMNTVEAMKSGTEQAKMSGEQGKMAGESLSSISQKVLAIKGTISDISVSSDEQTASAKSVTESVINIKNLSDITVDQSHLVKSTSQELMDMSVQLIELTNRFKL